SVGVCWSMSRVGVKSGEAMRCAAGKSWCTVASRSAREASGRTSPPMLASTVLKRSKELSPQKSGTVGRGVSAGLLARAAAKMRSRA
nr:hypothetical protein [Tanacetum cinerariifolium]